MRSDIIESETINIENTLQHQIDTKRQEIRTESYGMSVGEWISMYEHEDIDVHPEFQRAFRWSDQQKSDFIESLLLGIPIPPIFVSQRPDGVWDVIDGLQRLSTLYEFVGILKKEDESTAPPLCLKKTKYLPSLSGMYYNSSTRKSGSCFSSSQQRFLKRAKLDVNIIQQESDQQTKFDLFQRLNSGGTLLASQEIRSSIVLSINKDLFDLIDKMAKNRYFTETTSLSANQILEQYNKELVTRFMIFYNMDIEEAKGVRELKSFITDKIIDIAEDKNFDLGEAERIFNSTFQVLNEKVGKTVFRISKDETKYNSRFLVSAFEVISYGVAYNIDNLDENTLSGKCKKILEENDYDDWSGSGISAHRRLPHLLELGRNFFKR